MIEFKNLPNECRVSSDKVFKINLNTYRNAHYQVLANAKRWFHQYGMTLDIPGKFNVPVELEYKLSVRRGSDLMNYGAILDKFMCDALVARGLLADDNEKIVKKVSFEIDGYSKKSTGKLVVSQYER